RLYPIVGRQLATDTHRVMATKGYFRTTLTFPAELFNGQALWVGIKRGTDPELSPRTEIRPVPYALSLRPGAVVQEAFFTTYQAGDSTATHAGVDIFTTYRFNPGVRISTSGNFSEGVYAATSGYGSEGVDARTFGNYSYGVYAVTSGYGSYGVVATTSGYGSEGVYAATSGDSSAGVVAVTSGDDSRGVVAWTSGRESDGVNITTHGWGSDGVVARTYRDSSAGVVAATSGDDSRGVVAQTTGDGSEGVYAETSGYGSPGANIYSLKSIAIWAETGRPDHKYGVQTRDIIRALSYETGASDVAEYMPMTGVFPSGTVLVIGADGRLQRATEEYDTRVAGIVSTEPGVSLGANDRGNPGEQIIAIAGRVPCRVDATYGAIYPGDVLTTSQTPGHAMKAVPVNIDGVEIYKPSTVLGKALGSLDSGTGTIDVLVTLQ
ncbi:MAG: hypothetical protein WCB46_11645, partial [Methanoregula sp.]